MGIGSKTIIAALALCVMGAGYDKWNQCNKVPLGQSTSFVCLVKFSGALLGDHIKSLLQHRGR